MLVGMEHESTYKGGPLHAHSSDQRLHTRTNPLTEPTAMQFNLKLALLTLAAGVGLAAAVPAKVPPPEGPVPCHASAQCHVD